MNSAASFLFGDGTFWLEPAASTSAERHDQVFHAVLYVTGFFFALVMLLMLLFIYRYRRQKKNAAVPIGPTHNTVLEVVWTAVPLVVVTVLFVMGFSAFMELETPPANAEVIEVLAQQWSYSFTYPNGAVDNTLYLRLDRPALLRMTSKDVLHALYIPAFRVQRNMIQGRYTELWFKPTQEGEYNVFCTQYCGDGHSLMTTKAVVLGEADYTAKLAQLSNIFIDSNTKAPLPYAAVGEKLYKSNGCAQCHSVDGTPNQGPTWKDLYKRDHQFSVAPAGYTLSAADDDAKWDAYLRESILDPGAKVVRPFQNLMQPYRDRFSGTPYKEKKLAALVEYIKSLDNNGPGGKPAYYKPMPTPPADDSKPAAPEAGKARPPAEGAAKPADAAAKPKATTTPTTRETP